MPNGTLKLYNKLTNALLVSLDILGTFNIEDNLNETPSNMKVKVITSNTYREEFQVNTVAYHEDTNSWWVIKSDESSYMTTGEYEHEIQLVEYLEFYAYRHLPNCAFAPTTYTLEQMLLRLFDIAKLSITVVYPDFLDEDKIMPFFSFENFTVANAIKNIARAINAIPKMSVNLTGFVPTLTFINRNGIDEPIKDGLNDEFPIAYEKNINSSDQFTTRSVSNITNAKSSVLVITPESGGLKNTIPNNIVFDSDTRLGAKVFLPSKIDKIEWLNVLVPVSIMYEDQFNPPGRQVIFTGYFINKVDFENALTNSDLFGTSKPFPIGDLATAISRLPTPETFYRVNYGDVIDKNFLTNTVANKSPVFFKKMSLRSKFEFDTVSKIVGGISEPDNDTKERTAHWTPNTNELIMPLSFRNSLNANSDHNVRYMLLGENSNGQKRLSLTTETLDGPILRTVIKNENILIQVAYYPIADIKVSIDNDNDAQDEKFFNQSGKVVDAVSVTKLITSHTNDSVEGTKIRNAKHFALNDILPLGQLVRDNDQLYVISQRSIDGHVKNGNEYYNVIYTLSRNRIARSENIVADSSVISYKTPDDNLVFRSQLYKDYIELSLVNNNQEAPYLTMSKALMLSDTLAGSDFNFTVLAKNEFGTTPTVVRYVRNPTTFDLHKAKLMNVNWQDNNIVGFRFDRAVGVFTNTLVQTPILYTDEVGKATNFDLLFLDKVNIEEARNDFNLAFSGKASNLIPFQDLTQIDIDYYNTSVVTDGRFSIRIREDATGGRPYQKDPFEIPVFEYMIQGNDDYSNLGNIVIGNDLFTTFTGTLRYHYTINNTTRFTAENANKQYVPPPTTTTRRVIFDRSNANQLELDLFQAFSGSRNTVPITNIGIYATDGTTVKFLFAINDYAPLAGGINDISNIRVFINNWKI
jgi:hypothetical protein